MSDAPVHGTCRHCKTPLRHTFVDLGMSPLCETFLPADQLDQMEPFYPLHVFVCETCFLVQLKEYVSPESIFTEYAYFSSYSDSWLAHARAYTEQMIERWSLGRRIRSSRSPATTATCSSTSSQRGIPALGIEPAANVAKAAEAKNVPTRVAFFGRETARQLVSEGLRPTC